MSDDESGDTAHENLPYCCDKPLHQSVDDALADYQPKVTDPNGRFRDNPFTTGEELQVLFIPESLQQYTHFLREEVIEGDYDPDRIDDGYVKGWLVATVLPLATHDCRYAVLSYKPIDEDTYMPNLHVVRVEGVIQWLEGAANHPDSVLKYKRNPEDIGWTVMGE